MTRVVVLIASIAVSAACKRELNSEFCLAHPGDLRCGEIDAPAPPCTTTADCPGQVCDTPNARCVDCTPDDVSLCTATAPFCSTDNACRGCVVDDECDGAVCLPDGSCPAEADIIYASTTGTGNGGCGALAMPCNIVQAINEVTATRNIIKLAPDTAQDYQVNGNSGLAVSKDVTIDMRGARIRKISSGTAMTIGTGNNVTLLGGAITGGMNGGDGITCTSGVLTVIGTDIGGNSGSGIGDGGCGVIVDAATIHNNNSFGINKANGNLTLTRSEIRSNLTGGLLVTTPGTRFTIVGNVFWSNGSTGTLFGGVSLTTDTSTQSRLELNSFNSNVNNGNPGAAVICNVAGFTARNNVLFGNGTNDQATGSCAHVFSISAPGNPLAGQGNLASDPMFANASTGDLHTLPGSPTENTGDPGADLTGIAAFDRDGDPRTAPVDIGVDQHP